MVKLNRNNKLLRKTNKNFILFETKTNESFFSDKPFQKVPNGNHAGFGRQSPSFPFRESCQYNLVYNS